MKKFFILVAIFFWLASCGTVGNNTDIINPEAEYLYFFGATCPHCQELNKIMNDEGLFSKISVEKREVWFNEENQALFQEKITELGLEEWRVWVPFVYDKVSGEHAVGVDPALTLFKNRLGGVTSTVTEVESEIENIEALPEDLESIDQ